MNNLKINSQALKISLYFAVVGILWILFSDKLVTFYFNDIKILEDIQTYKGWFFVVATSILIYFLIRNQLSVIQRKNIELSKSMVRYRSTLDNMLEGAQIIDHNWTYVYVNDVVAKHGKKTKSELLGKTMMEAYPEIENTKLFEHLKQCMEERIPQRKENEFYFPDGSKGYFELSIQPIPEGIFILSYDVTERVHAEKEIKIGEGRLIEAQRIAKLGDFTWDIESGEITWSDPLYELLGYDKSEEITYEKINNYVHHPDDLTEVLDWLNKSLKADSEVLPPNEYRLLKKNGEVIHVITRGKIKTIEGKKKIFATVQDITARKKAEFVLRENEERYRNLFMHSPDAIFINEQDKITMVNEAFVTLMDAPNKDKLIGKTPYDIFHPDIHETVKNRIYRVRELGENPPSYEEKVVQISGNVLDVEVQRATFKMGNANAIHVILHDITARKQAEEEIKKHREQLEKLVQERTEELYKSEEKYRGLYESVKDGIVHADMKGNIIECNPEFARMLQYDMEELKKMTLHQITPNYLLNGIDKVINEEILENGYTDAYEKEYIRKDGSTVPVSIRGWLITGKNNEAVGMWGIIRDITKQKEYEEFITTLNDHLQERQKELEMANKELEAFAYSVSHDLRAPLRAIDGFTNILMEEYLNTLDDEAQRLGKVIQDNSKKMRQLIDDLLTFSRMGRASMNPSEIDMKNMAHSIYHEASSEEQRNKIDFDVTDLPRIKADPSMMRHVWMNLISNAIKYASDKEIIKINISYKTQNNHVIYSIRDNGVGFDMKHKDKLFGVFQRLHSPRDFEGTGVGLALVHRIITRHGGKIWAEAQLNKGATFYFSLPEE